MSISLPALKKKFFNKSVAGLAKQGFRQSKEKEGSTSPSCLYRSKSDGQTIGCAIGVLVPPRVRIPPGENSSPVSNLPSEFLMKIGIDPANDGLIRFLGELQTSHDSPDAADPEVMKSHLKALARAHRIPIPAVLK